jgi:glycerol-3-phosphate dehydrogenase
MISKAAASDRIKGLAGGDALDVLVIGGGIVGGGVARDAAMRGLSVGIVEQHDFASGTSSRSSRLLHGGLRYLAQGRVGLVREASLEKRIVQDIAPHLVEPLAFVFPTYRGTQWTRWKLGLGVKIYDLLCNGRNFGRSQTLGPQKVSAMLHGIRSAGLTGAVRYYDGLTQDARLVIDTLRSAETHGARLHNYMRYEDASFNKQSWECQLHDNLNGRRVSVRARTVINAAGPWADRLKHSRTRLRLTKGVHLVVDRERLPLPDAVVMARGSRILFAIPWGARMILGTTDTDYTGPPGTPTCDREDIRYVLGVTNNVFPNAGLTDEDVIATWAGLRPLIANGQEKGAPSDTSRSHSIQMIEPGWIDVAGGKLTTYRLMAEQTVDKIVAHLDRDTVACQTAERPLLAKNALHGSGIIPPEVSREQVEHYCQNEWAVHLDDVMIRRSSWAYYHKDAAAIAGDVAGWMSDICQWDPQQADEEMRRYRWALTYSNIVTPSAVPPREAIQA